MLLDSLTTNASEPLPGRRHRRRLATAALVVLAAGAPRCGAEDPAQGPQGHQRHLHPRQPRRGGAPILPAHLRRVRVEQEAIHVTWPDGRRLLVIHGDQFDGIVRYARWLAILGDWAYNAALRVNTAFNWGRRRLGLPYWSLSAYLKHRVKNAVQFIGNYESAVAGEARRRGVDGVVRRGTSTTPRSAPSTACSTATMATGSKAARRSSRIQADGCASCAGPRNVSAASRFVAATNVPASQLAAEVPG